MDVFCQHHIRGVSGRYCAYMAHADFPGRIDRGALDRQHRVHAALNRFSDHGIQMARMKQIVTLSVVAAKGQRIIEANSLNPLHNCFHVLCDGAFPCIHIHACPQLTESFLPIGRLMAGIRTAAQISGKLPAAQPRGMALEVKAALLCRFDNIHHPFVTVHHSVKIHHLGEADHALKLCQLTDLPGKKLGSGIFAARHSRNTARNVHKLAHRKIVRTVMHVFNSIHTVNIGKLMGIMDYCSSSVRNDDSGKISGRHHRAFDMHMGIDEARDQVPSFSVVNFKGTIRPFQLLRLHMSDKSIFYIYDSRINLPCKYIDQTAVIDCQIGRFQPQGRF